VCAVDSPIDRNVHPHETACKFCTEKADPNQTINRVTVSLAIGACQQHKAEQQAVIHRYRKFVNYSARPSNADRLERILAGEGPGSQLWKLLESLGVKHKVDCGCLGRAEQMNAWGVAGCRASRADIVAWMLAGKDDYGWSTIVKAGGMAVLTGVAWRLSILDPYGSLVDEAIRRAEQALPVPPMA
jgi:hypothetical protein